MKLNNKICMLFLLASLVQIGLTARNPMVRPIAEDGQIHGMGLIPKDPSTIPSWHKLDTERFASHAPVLPSSVINTTYLPPVADQGIQGSCVAWAVAYYAKTYMEAKEHDWDPSLPSHEFSPAYIYNQACYRPDNGMTFGDATEILSRLGCATLDQMSYDPFGDTTWPSEAAYKEAMRYRIGQVTYIDPTQSGGLAAIKQWLAQGNVAVAGITVYSNFYSLSSYDYNYCLSDTDGPMNWGAHATTIIGYDDTRVTDDGVGAFRCVNSWGTLWGDKGYYWLSYQSVIDPNRKIVQGPIFYWQEPVGENPSVAAKFTITYDQFRDLHVSISSDGKKVPLWNLSSWQDASSRNLDLPAPGHPVWVDISDLSGPTYSLTARDGINLSVQGSVDGFSVVQPTKRVETLSPDPPLSILPPDSPALIPNGGFEDGLSGWTSVQQEAGSAPVITTSNTHSGSSAAFLNSGGNGPGNSLLYHDITAPAWCATLVVWCYLEQQDPGPDDFQAIEADERNAPVGADLSLSSNARVWEPCCIDLTPFEGEITTISLWDRHDGTTSGSTSMTVDDVALLTQHPAVASVTLSSLPPPTVTATAAPASVTTGQAVGFSASAAGGSGGYSFLWTFGDQSGSEGQNASHTYSKAGTYDAYVTVTDSYGTRVSSNCVTVNVYDPLTVALFAWPPWGTTPLPLTFTAQAKGGDGHYAYSYDYGDGTTGTEPDHAYTKAGTYSARVTVTDTVPHTATSTDVTVLVWGPLTADITASPESGTIPLSVQFSSHVVGGDGAYAYVWDFGDGTTTNVANPVKTFSASGDYRVTLTVTDRASHSVTSAPVTVSAHAPLSVSIAASETSGTPPLSVDFTSDVAGGDGPYNYAWDFGDGTTANTPSTTKIFSAAGAYDATLTVTDSSSHTARSNTIHVTAVSPPVVDSMTKMGNPFRITVYGSNLQEGLKVYIDGRLWGDTSNSRLVKWKDENKIVIKKGHALKNSVPKSTDTVFRFVNPDGGETTLTWRWP